MAPKACRTSARNKSRAILLMAAWLTLPAVRAVGGAFAYTNADWIACFRTTGGATDLIVNLGPASRFRGQPWGVRIPVASIPESAWQETFPSLDGIQWSVLGSLRGNPAYPELPLQTLWLTSPIDEKLVAGAAWNRQGNYTQGAVASQIEAIGIAATAYGALQPTGLLNSSALIGVPSTEATSYTALVSAEGNLGGTFQGSVENSTTVAFAAGQSGTSLVYELAPLPPGSPAAAGTLLGWFELTPTGELAFTAGPPPSRVVQVSRQDSDTVITVTTVPTIRYRVRSSPSFATESTVGDWEPAGSWFDGTGDSITLRVPSASTTRFYAVEAAP